VTNRQAPERTEFSDLDNDHLAGVLEAIHDGEIRISQIAEELVTAPEVKRFAHAILAAYATRLDEDKTLWSASGVTPAASHVSGKIDTQTQTEAMRLGEMDGSTFDAEYVAFEVRSQGKALDVLDSIIDGNNTELKTELVAARQEIGEHLREARTVQAELRPGHDF
jgi:predicted outer membrane protein